MEISKINFKPITIPDKEPKQQQNAVTEQFSNVLREKLEQVNELQLQANKVTENYLAGEVQDLHQVMIATEKANLALQLTVEVRNKLIEAYQELYRLQI